jgi:hypothetical protein
VVPTHRSRLWQFVRRSAESGDLSKRYAEPSARFPIVGAASIATPAPGPRVVELQAGAGGKRFRIQVQFDVPKSCSKPCTGTAERRTRNGRGLYAVTPLPGDGKVVLGRRSGIPLFKGVGKKVRLYLTVSKAELLRAPFSTQGGNRLAQTRRRVTLRTATGSALYVRDGQIKVSIARIKSGALPGLKGIL